jgi:NADH-quinone oxidoreductase subunit N
MIIFVVFCSLTLCISANNFLILLLGIEGAILSVWFLLMRNQGNAMRYLLISSIISGIFLYGSSLYYSEFGSLCFSYISDNKNLVFIIGTILILSALLFEIHAAPFHSWVIDIYEKASTTMVMFFDTVFQFFMFFVFAKMIDIFINKHILFYKPFLYFASILSMLIGGVMPIRQKSINKFIAYSSVGHIGFILSILATTNHAADFKRSIFYIFSYIVSSSCFFFSILVLQKNKSIKEFSDLKGVINNAPIIGYSLILSLFSMIGLPPFINFFAKLKIIGFLISKNAWLLLSVSIFYSILGFLYTAKVARYLFMPDIESNAELTNKKFYSAAIPLVALILGIFISSRVESSFSEIFISAKHTCSS